MQLSSAPALVAYINCGVNLEGNMKRALIFLGGLQMFKERLQASDEADLEGFHEF